MMMRGKRKKERFGNNSDIFLVEKSVKAGSDYRCKVRIIRDREITVHAKNKKEAEEVICTLSKEMEGSENQWERGYNAGLQFAMKTLQRLKNNYPSARVEG